MLDVAARAGVAVSSVSRALSGHPEVSAELRTRVQTIAAERGYEPDLLASSLRRGSTMTVGFVVRDIANPLFAEIAAGAEHILKAAGYAMVVVNSDGDALVEADHIHRLRRRRVDGLLVSLVTESPSLSLDRLAAAGCGLVLLDREVPGVRASAALVDHYAGARSAVADLLSLGHRRLALVTGGQDIRPTRERIRGFLDAHHEAGVRPNARRIVRGDFSPSFAHATTDRLLASRHPPTAFVSGGVQTTLGMLRSMQRKGVLVGRDVALVACDDTDMLDLLRPSVSVVRRDHEALGAAAAQLFLDSVARRRPRVVTLPTQYVRRGSSSPPPRSAPA